MVKVLMNRGSEPRTNEVTRIERLSSVRLRSSARVAVACGGSGGHLFPGVAVAECLRTSGCEVILFISAKVQDLEAIRQVVSAEALILPATALQRGERFAFFVNFVRSYNFAKMCFHSRPVNAAITMGGFTGPPVILAARALRASTFLHESNTIPGRANRLLSRVVTRVFVSFASTAAQMHCRHVTITGTPIRTQFRYRESETARKKLGLNTRHPVILIMGGSQGASAVNQACIRALPAFAKGLPNAQWLHLTGVKDHEKVKQAYAKLRLNAIVLPFLAEMELLLAAASLVISRAGASSLAELAAMRVPALLMPYQLAVGNHQWHNAVAFEKTHLARVIEEQEATPERLAQSVYELLGCATARATHQAEGRIDNDKPAAEQVADAILETITGNGISLTGPRHPSSQGVRVWSD